MRLAENTPTHTAAPAPGSDSPAQRALASGQIGARILRLAQVAAAVHAARAAHAEPRR